MVEDKLRVFSVFSGIGGFELGLLNSDYVLNNSLLNIPFKLRKYGL